VVLPIAGRGPRRTTADWYVSDSASRSRRGRTEGAEQFTHAAGFFPANLAGTGASTGTGTGLSLTHP
jgi:hypothetical protein